MTSLKVIIAYVVMTVIVDSSSGRKLSKLTDPNQQLVLSQRESNAFLNRRDGYSSGYEDEEGTAELAKTTEPPTTTPTQSPTTTPIQESSPTTTPTQESSTTPCSSECDKECEKNLCRGTTKNHTIDVGDGKKVICLVPTEEELIEHLNEIGGYNHHSVALTLEEAEENFDDLLKPYLQRPVPFPGRGRGKKIGHARIRHPHHKPHVDHKTYKRAISCETPSCLPAGQELKAGQKRMCPLCQRCTKLPDDVFPRYINEITCDSTSQGHSRHAPSQCYMKAWNFKFGSCRQKSITIDVLTKQAEDYELVKTDGTTTIYKQVWSTKTQEIRTCCECFS